MRLSQREFDGTMIPPEHLWCDLSCPHASFPEQEHLDGACHTFIALFCKKHKQLVPKSGPCLELTEGVGNQEEGR